MKTILRIFIIQIFIINILSAQDFYLEVKNEVSVTDIKFAWSSFIENESKTNKPLNNFSIGLSGKLSKHLFVKTTFGSNNFINEINLNWRSGGISHDIEGWVLFNQNYLEILPELRFFKSQWLYVNMGMGFNQIKSSKLTEGFYEIDSNIFYGNNNFPSFAGKNEYFIGHLGVNLNFNKLAVILEYGYRLSGFTEPGDKIPNVGFKQNSFKFGIRYKIRSNFTENETNK